MASGERISGANYRVSAAEVSKAKYRRCGLCTRLQPKADELNFRQGLAARYLRCDAETFALGVFFHSHHGGMAANPLAPIGRNLGRHQEHEFDIRHLLDLGLGKEEQSLR